MQHPTTVVWFFKHGANPNARCKLDLTPTSYAVAMGTLTTLDLFLAKGADIRKGQLLHYAVLRDFDAADAVRLLIDLGCPINEVKYENDPVSWNERMIHGLGTPLHRAAEFGRTRIVEILLKSGADTDILDSKGCTALY